LRVHVTATAPAVVRREQLQADFVFQHVWRRIGLDMQSAPKGDSRCRAVRRRISLVVHDFQACFFVVGESRRTLSQLIRIEQCDEDII
jgi:hypothetical protein